jgi:hypothetical protein
MVSDIFVMPALSSELREVAWLDGATGPAAGHRFTVPITLRLANSPGCRGVVGVEPQPPGSVRVEVSELDGGLMQDAQETLHARRDGPVLREARTGEDGLVLFENLEPVEYVIRATKPEYVTVVLPCVEVTSGRRFPVRLTLRRADSPRPCEPLAGVAP